MSESCPSKSDIEAVFNKLRSVATNKTCFDCGAKNPTWASVTYGIFICIDCSAVHRSLGVHLTFVRSTQLDTNWTWQQLRQMQLGGNAAAMQFFVQHNCETSDAQKKYNSRAAQLYRNKLQQLALHSLETNPEKLHVSPHVEEKVDEKEVDFFANEENVAFPDAPKAIEVEPPNPSAMIGAGGGDLSSQPSVNFDKLESSEDRKPIIGGRKVQPKRLGLGAKKGGLGATKVKTNFAEVEREANMAEEARVQAARQSLMAMEINAEDEDKMQTYTRLAYTEVDKNQAKAQEKLKQTDPKKAEQVERLGMGVATKTSGVSHSALSDMQTIEQENLQVSRTPLSKVDRSCDNDNFFDSYAFSSPGLNMNRNSNSMLSDLSSRYSDWSAPEPATEKSRFTAPPPKSAGKSNFNVDNSEDAAQKKFGSAKAISSDQFFDNNDTDYETKAALNKFQGSSSISSADLFGTPQKNTNASFHPPDLEDVKESVRQGVTKVAGKLSSLANGVMSSIQDRYGY